MSNRTDTTAAARLRELRKAAGLTQAKVAAAAEMSQPAYARLESGERDLRSASAGTALRIARALGVSVEELLPPA